MVYNLFVLYEDRSWEVEQVEAESPEMAEVLSAPMIGTATEGGKNLFMYFLTAEEPIDA